MEIQDQTIECVRCTNTEKLVVPALVQKMPNGPYEPVNTQRPTGWIAGPADVGDVKKGLCPDCVVDWSKAQERFLTHQAPDEAPKELRTPTSMPVKSIAPITSTMRPVTVSSINNHGVAHVQLPNSIPQRAAVIEKPAITANARPALTQQMAKNPHGVTMSQTLRTIKAETPSLNSLVGRVGNNGATVTGGVTHHSVPVAASAVVKEAAPVLLNRIGDGLPSSSAGAVGVSAPSPLPAGAGMVNSSAPSPLPPGARAVNSSAPVPIVGGGMVQTSAPVPLPPVAPSSAGVTISAPVPITKAAAANDLKIDMSDVPA